MCLSLRAFLLCFVRDAHRMKGGAGVPRQSTHFALERKVLISVMYMSVTESRGILPEMDGMVGEEERRRYP